MGVFARRGEEVPELMVDGQLLNVQRLRVEKTPCGGECGDLLTEG